MKIKSFIIGAMALLGCATAQANDCMSCNPCYSCDPCGDGCFDGWSVYGDWLYWRVRRSGLDYVIDGNIDGSGESSWDLPFGKQKCVDPTYQSGWRIGVAKKFCDFDVGVRYTSYSPSHTSSTDSFDLVATRIHPVLDEDNISSVGSSEVNSFNFAQARYELELNQLDVEFGKPIDSCDDFRVRPFVGFRFARIDQTMKTFYDVRDISINETLDVKAYGAYFGVGARYTFCGSFGLHANFSGGLYLASVSGHNNQFQNSEDTVSGSSSGEFGEELIHVSDCGNDLLLGSVDLALGASYELNDCFCGNWLFSVGYEFHKWSDFPDFINFTDDGAYGTVARNHSNFGYDGAYVRVKFEF